MAKTKSENTAKGSTSVYEEELNCYVKIKGFTIYIEVSEATNNEPSVSYWTEAYPQDATTILEIDKKYSGHWLGKKT